LRGWHMAGQYVPDGFQGLHPLATPRPHYSRTRHSMTGRGPFTTNVR
jgi:hypothetical protein